MASPVSVASYGNNSQVAQGVRSQLLPDYDVAHICLTLEAAEAELPLVCSGELGAEPASGLGTNATLPTSDRKVPRAIIFGGGIPEEEISRVTEAVKAKVPGIKPIQVTRQDVLDTGAAGPNPEVIVKILREKLAGI